MNNQKDISIAKEVLRIRLSQLIINEKYKNSEFKVPIHLALGHEAIAVAVGNIMGDNDQLALTHRNIHYNLARSQHLKPEIDEYSLRESGLGQGRLGSMNLANKEGGIVYTSNILGNNLAVACGIAMGKKVKKENGLVIVSTGDGAIEEGCFYESLIFAKSNDLPMIIIVENNQWSLGTRIEERRCAIDIKKLVSSIDIEYVSLASNDSYEYIEQLRQLKAKALAEKTPVCVEVHLESLGSWIMEKEGYPNGKFINYHAGPAPTVDISKGITLKESKEDPVFVLENHFSKDYLEELMGQIKLELEGELVA